MKNKIELSKDKRTAIISEIKSYFLTEREEEIGDLAAGFLLDFFVEKLGPELYNKGVADSYRYMIDKVEDLMGIQKY